MKKTKDTPLTIDRLVSRSMSVLGSSAQNTSLCNLESSSEKLLNSYISKVVACPTLSNVDKGIMLLCLCEGLRISEVLFISRADWRAGSKVFVYGKKGSFNRVVTVRFYKEELQSYTKANGFLNSAGSRFYYYREMKKLGIVFKSGNSSKASVTHAGRHLLADDIFQRGEDIELSKRTLGHKSVNSTKHYVEKKN